MRILADDIMITAVGDDAPMVLKGAIGVAQAYFDRMGLRIQVSKCIRMSTKTAERRAFRKRANQSQEGMFTKMLNAMRDLGANLNVTRGHDSGICKTRFNDAADCARMLSKIKAPIEKVAIAIRGKVYPMAMYAVSTANVPVGARRRLQSACADALVGAKGQTQISVTGFSLCRDGAHYCGRGASDEPHSHHEEDCGQNAARL